MDKEFDFVAEFPHLLDAFLDVKGENTHLRGLLRRSRQMIQRGKNHMVRLDEFDPELIDELEKELGDD